MKQNRGYPQLTVTKRAEHSIIKGHPWVYYNEITAEQPFADGELVDVVSQKGSYLGTGFANSNSKIRVRLITPTTALTMHSLSGGCATPSTTAAP